MRRVLWFTVFWALASSAALAEILYVDAAAGGASDGSSWADAFTDLQAALAAAESGDEIWVAEGTYRPTAAADRAVAFALKEGVGIYGGFAGAETQRGERDPAANVTILSGDIGVAGHPADNSYHVVVVGGTLTAAAVLDGFTITAGHADGAGDDVAGGGMWMSGGTPTLSGLIFIANFGEGVGGLRVTGGTANLTGCQFLSNTGGGASTNLASFTCRGCVFRSNAGPGIWARGGLTLVNTIVAENSVGVQVILGGQHTFVNCTIAHNGTGLYLISSEANTLKNTIIWGNDIGIFPRSSSFFTASYCDLQNYWGDNLHVDPLFVAPPGDLRPGMGSPVVDAGNNGAVPPFVTTDVAGLPRFSDDPDVPDTGAGTPPIVDMGAHEWAELWVTSPQSLAQCEGTDAFFSVTAAGQPPLSFQWFRDGAPLSDDGRVSGSQTAMLSIHAIVEADEGGYAVVVTDGGGGSVSSPTATLTVNPPRWSRSGDGCVSAQTPRPVYRQPGL